MLALHSCTIEKRRYTRGYHIEWRHNSCHAKKSTQDINLQNKVIEKSQDDEAIFDIKADTSICNGEEKILTVPLGKESQVEQKRKQKPYRKNTPRYKTDNDDVYSESSKSTSQNEDRSSPSYKAWNIIAFLKDYSNPIKVYFELSDANSSFKKKRKKKKKLLSKVKNPGKVGGMMTVGGWLIIFLAILLMIATVESTSIALAVLFIVLLWIGSIIGALGFILAIRSFRKNRLKKHGVWVLIALGYGPFFFILAFGIPVMFIIVLIASWV